MGYNLEAYRNGNQKGVFLMRKLVSLFTVVIVAILSAPVLASIATRASIAQQPQQSNQLPSPFVNNLQATNKFADPEPAETVILPGSQIIAGNPDKNEFFIVGKDQPTPPALIAAQKLAEERVKPVQAAIDEAKKTIQEMKVPKLEKALGNRSHKVNIQAQASSIVTTALQQMPETVQAENDINPQLGNMIAAPVLSDATVAAEPNKAAVVPEVAKAPVKPVKKIKPLTKVTTDKKAPIKHVFNAQQSTSPSIVNDKKPVVVASETKPTVVKKKVVASATHKLPMVAKQKAINIKALLAKVEVVRPKTLSAKKALQKPVASAANKKVVQKPVASAAKKVRLSLTKTNQEVKHGNTSFKVKTVTAE